MKFFSLVFIVLTACSTGVIKDDWTKSLIGKTGYIREPVQIVADQKKNWAPFGEFKRCEPIEVVEAREYGKNTGLTVKQNEKLFYIFSAQKFVSDYKANPTATKLDEYIAPTLDDALGKKRPVKLANGNFDSQQLQCQSTFWAGMTADELFFVKGRPEQINKSSPTHQQWVYSQANSKSGKAQYFELVNDVVTSWQE